MRSQWALTVCLLPVVGWPGKAVLAGTVTGSGVRGYYALVHEVVSTDERRSRCLLDGTTAGQQVYLRVRAVLELRACRAKSMLRD